MACSIRHRSLDPAENHRRLPLFSLAFLLLAIGGCRPSGSNDPVKPPDVIAPSGHERMQQMLKEIADKTSDEHPFLGTLKARELRTRLQQLEAFRRAGRDVNAYDRWQVQYDLGKAEVRLGNVEAGIKQLHAAYDLLPEVDFAFAATSGQLQADLNDGDLNEIYANRTRFELAIGFLRLAETQNCCLKHNAESCILPIQGGGVHEQREGSEAAARLFLEVLEHGGDDVKMPDDERLEVVYAAKWLLNLARMTLGEFPDGVPAEYRISPEFFQSDIEFPKFHNVAPKLGLDTFSLCGGAICDDFDGDDQIDIVTSSWDTQHDLRFFRNNGDGSFADLSEQAGLRGFFGGLNMVQADYDNDGDTDVFVLRGAWLRGYGQHPNSLLQNDGRGHFRDVTFEAGLGEKHFPTKTAAWGDYDLDGDLDLFIGNESTQDLDSPSQLFRNNGNGTFTDVSERAGVNLKMFAMGSSWGDFDGDRYPDLYVSTGFSNLSLALNDGSPNRLFHNQRDGRFVEVAEERGVTQPSASFASWFWDFNNDGLLDIYATCSSGPVGVLVSDRRFGLNCLYRGKPDGGFEEVSAAAGLTYPAQPMGANFGDLNNDGFLDFYLGTGNLHYSEVQPNVMFLNQGGETFINVTMAGGFGHLQKGHGVSFGDLDNDGDQDIYAEMGGAWPGDKYNDVLFENPGFGNHWIGIKLVGTKSNRSAIGARICAHIVENGKPRQVYKFVNSGGSFGCNPLRQWLGLGSATQIETLEIFWPATGETQVFSDLPVDRLVRITEESDQLDEIPLTPFRLGGKADPASTSVRY